MLPEGLAEKLQVLVPPSIREASWLRPRYPLVGVELRDDCVIAVRMTRAQGKYRIAGYGRRELREGLFSASLMRTSTEDAPGLVRAVQDVLSLAGAANASRISLALPDSAARVFVIDVEDLPLVPSQAAEMIRWRIKKSVPFRPDESRLAWHLLGRAEDGRTQVLVTIAPEAPISLLENVFGAAGLRVGLVDLCTFNLFNLLRLSELKAIPGRDVALINATPSYFSIVLFRGERLMLYRSKPYHVQGVFQGEESLRVVTRELRSTLSYYEEHLLGQGISETLLRTAHVPAHALLEAVKAGGLESARTADATQLLPELRSISDLEPGELFPALGLALRRVA